MASTSTKFGETYDFWVENLLEFYFTSNFMMSQKLEPLFPNIIIQHLKIQKQNFKILVKLTNFFPKLLIFPQDFFNIFPKFPGKVN